MPLPAPVVLVPVKAPALGKSRLGLPDDRRRTLARAFALDTLAAACAARVGAVYVVTDDEEVGDAAIRMGCGRLPDDVGLNASLVAAARLCDPAGLVVALCADLPALRPADLALVVESLGPDGGVVADADGVGTTLYAAPATRFSPEFGLDSRAAHLRQGRPEVELAVPTLRRDVDDLASLGEAIALGVGPHTRAALDQPA